MMDAYHDISNICMSIPAVLNANGIARHITIQMDEDETQKLQASAKALKEIIREFDI